MPYKISGLSSKYDLLFKKTEIGKRRVSRALGMGDTYISHLCAEFSFKKPSLTVFVEIMNIFDLSIDEFLDDNFTKRLNNIEYIKRLRLSAEKNLKELESKP